MYVLTTSSPVNTAIYNASFVLYDGTANFSNILILSMNTLSTLPFPPYNTTYHYHYSYTFFSAGSFPPPSLLLTGDEFSSINFLAMFKFLYLIPYITNATTQALISYNELVLVEISENATFRCGVAIVALISGMRPPAMELNMLLILIDYI